MSKILAYMRKWAFDGVTPQKERKENGRLAWPWRFKLHPVTLNRCLADDIALVSKEEIDRLTRELAEWKADQSYSIACQTIRTLKAELAEAKARAVIPDGFEDGWKDALLAWEICSSIHRAYAKGKDPFFKTRQSDFTKSAKNARAMLSARPEHPPNGFPSKESGNG